jgi:hypothetical protein
VKENKKNNQKIQVNKSCQTQDQKPMNGGSKISNYGSLKKPSNANNEEDEISEVISNESTSEKETDDTKHNHDYKKPAKPFGLNGNQDAKWQPQDKIATVQGKITKNQNSK